MPMTAEPELLGAVEAVAEEQILRRRLAASAALAETHTRQIRQVQAGPQAMPVVVRRAMAAMAGSAGAAAEAALAT